MTQSPVRPRIMLADSLRGFALMGLYIVHMVEYFELYWSKPEPGWVHNLIFFLFGGKAYGLFALLFGLSFFIILDNYQRRGQDFRLRFGLMFVGAVLGRTGFFERADIALTQLMKYLFTALIAYLTVFFIKDSLINAVPAGMPRWSAGQVFTYYENLALIAAGVVIFMLLFKAEFSRKVLLCFAPAGRLTLTFYIAQSLVFVPVFYGFGCGTSVMGRLNGYGAS